MSRTFEGSPPFGPGARLALRDGQLRRNLGHATATIRAKRNRVVAELDTWEDLRLAGEAVKTAALGDLDHLLSRLEERVTEAGGVVHWARDAEEANRIIVGIVAAHGDDDVVKVKSMTTAETGLNAALEQAGITAYETDLAELIVQLGDDLPSHIVVPAIHRSRAQIRRTFVDEMGHWGRPPPEGLTDEPADLAAAARLHLRERFLSARVGISGANFLVAETGSVVVVESEGNGRMCLTLPEVLITVAGIDKVIPRWEDLDIFLQVLPRSATGERMNPYNSVWTGTVPGDGPREFHLVLLDNGRARALGDRVGRQALRCIRCAACLNVCPVYERVGGHAYGSVYPGPIGAVLTPQLDHVAGDDVAASLPYASTLCGACFDACPVRIDIPRLLVHLRGEVVDGQRRGVPRSQEQLTMAAAAWILARPRRLVAATGMGRIAGRLVGTRHLRLPGFASGWTAGRDTPLPSQPSFAQWWDESRASPGLATRSGAPAASDAAAQSDATAPLRTAVRSGAPAPFGTAVLSGAPAPPDVAARADASIRADVAVGSVPVALIPRPVRRSRVGPVPAGLRAAPGTGDAWATSEEGSAREVILRRVRRSLAGERAEVAVPRAYRRAPGSRPADDVELFTDRVGDYRATVSRVAADQVPATIAHLVERAGASSVVVPPDLPAEWTAGVTAAVLRDDGALSTAQLDAVSTVVTACAVAIAETGTVVLDAGPGQGRRALTLLPDHHVVVVRADQIVAGVPDAMGRLRATSTQTWISGPSATSDIELSRVEGVHGPRNLDVVIVDATPDR